MVASLKFESATGIEATNLQDTRIVTLEDTGGSTYTLDITTNDLKVEYTPTGGQKVEKIINGLAAALGKLLTIDGSTAGKSVLAEEVAKKPVVDALIPELAKDDGTTGIYTKKGVDDELAKKADTSAIPATPDLSNYLETSKLAEEVAKKPVVEAIFDLEDNGAKISETKIGTTFAKKTDLDNKADANGTNLDDAKVTAILEKLTDKVVKTSELSAKAADKAVAEAIFDAKDNQKSILVEKLGGFLDAPETPYGAQGDQAAKDFLGKKGLKPLPSEVASELIANNKQDLANEVANNPGLQTAVANNPGLKAVLAKPVDIAAIPALQEAVAKNADLQEAVAKNGDLQKAVAAIPALQTAVAENVDLQEAVAENVDFREAVAMDADLRTAVAADAGLQAAVAENEDLQKALAAIPALQTAVANNADLKAILAKPADIAAIPALQTAVAADAGLRTAVAENEDLQKALAAIPALQNTVAHNADWLCCIALDKVR